MVWSNNSIIVEELELGPELRHVFNQSHVRTQVPLEHPVQTHRGLKSRHIQLIALGGSIGTGLFVGTGTTLSLAGPAPLFMCTFPCPCLISRLTCTLAFIVVSAIVWVVVQSLAEMTAYLPVQGASVPYYVHRFFDPSLAFAAGWNYWYSYAMLVAAEISAASVVIDYWDNPVYVVPATETQILY